MKIALDTNVLVYAEGVNDEEKRDTALDLMHRLSQETLVIPVQVLGELFHVLVRKAGRSRAAARDALLGWCDTFKRFQRHLTFFCRPRISRRTTASEYGILSFSPPPREPDAGCFCRKTCRMASHGAARPWSIPL